MINIKIHIINSPPKEAQFITTPNSRFFFLIFPFSLEAKIKKVRKKRKEKRKRHQDMYAAACRNMRKEKGYPFQHPSIPFPATEKKKTPPKALTPFPFSSQSNERQDSVDRISHSFHPSLPPLPLGSEINRTKKTNEEIDSLGSSV
jgi:hypothetical protein